MRRREFISLLGGAAAWPLAARAQQPDPRRVVFLTGTTTGNPDTQAGVAVLQERLQQLGWINGHNIQLEVRWGEGNAERTLKEAIELAALVPDVIVTSGTAALSPMLQVTRSVPIVFTNVADPVGAGYVESLRRPGGNATGFMQFEYNVSGKWLEVLKEIAPTVTQAAVLRDPTLTAGIGQFAVIQSVAPSIGVEVTPVNLRDAGEIERAVTAFARVPNGGLILTASALSVVHGDLIISLAARYRLPAVYYRRGYVTRGGLASYGYNILQQYQRAADYVDRILKGAKPSDLPVQAPTRYELVINLKTAKALGLSVPTTLLARADEVIE
jgi:putative tryptophan/tyrosine transport system substrate-binding protein